MTIVCFLDHIDYFLDHVDYKFTAFKTQYLPTGASITLVHYYKQDTKRVLREMYCWLVWRVAILLASWFELNSSCLRCQAIHCTVLATAHLPLPTQFQYKS